MKFWKTIILLALVPAIYFGQQNEQQEGDYLNSRTSTNTKSLERYYQNVFQMKSTETTDNLEPGFDIDKKELAESMMQKIPLDGPVNPERYIVGPGDMIQLNVWGEIPYNYTLPVSPEGSLLVPDYGVIDVKNKTLAEVKNEIKEKLRENYLKGDITATLVSPRTFAVTVSGIVSNPGSFVVSSVTRVDEAVYMANLTRNVQDLQKQQTRAERKEFLNSTGINYFNDADIAGDEQKMSLRNIIVYRKNGDTLKADLARFYATGDNRYNPYLADGDRIVIPNMDLEGNSLTVAGAVRLKGTYEYTDTDSLGSVFELAQGPTALADMDKVDLYRLNGARGEYEHFEINYRNIKAGISQDIPLKAGDRVIIREKYPRSMAYSVTVKGEIKKPGLYPIVKSKTKLSEVIEQAEGFTPYASLSEARVIRVRELMDESQNNPDYARLVEMRLSDMDERQRQYFNLESAIKRNFISVDFEKLFVEKDSTNDITLKDGDVILIPPKENTVYVYGQVAQPGFLSYNGNRDYEYYIELAGGTTEMADDSEIRIIKAGTKNWLEPGDTEIEPGDTIWVPRDREYNFGYYFSWFSQIVGVLGGIATIYLLTKQ